MGHIGLTPQSMHMMGGFKVQGKELDAVAALIADARALADAGCFAIVLEGVPDTVAAMITESVAVPTIGIGAGPSCDGQVLVFHDLLGLDDRSVPKFVRQYAHLKADAVAAVAEFAATYGPTIFPTLTRATTWRARWPANWGTPRSRWSGCTAAPDRPCLIGSGRCRAPTTRAALASRGERWPSSYWRSGCS